MKKKIIHTTLMSVIMGSIMPLIVVGSKIGFSPELIVIWKSVLPKSIPAAFLLSNIFNPLVSKLTHKIVK